MGPPLTPALPFPHVEDLLIINAGRHSDLNTLVPADTAFAVAGLARGFHDLAGAAAAVAGLGGLHHAERRALVDPHLARAVAMLAGLWRRASRRAGAMAVSAGFDLGVGDGLLAAFGSLFKGDGNVRLDIAATAGRIGVGPAAAAAKTAEKAVKDIGEIKAPRTPR